MDIELEGGGTIRELGNMGNKRKERDNKKGRKENREPWIDPTSLYKLAV